MGWVNYVLLPKFKVAIVVHRSVEELEDYIEKALDYLTGEDVGEVDIDKEFGRLTARDFKELITVYEEATKLQYANPATLLLYFLKKYEIEYEVKSEFEIDENRLESEGWVIVDSC